MKLEHIKSYYIINGLCLFIVCVILTFDLPKFVTVAWGSNGVYIAGPIHANQIRIWLDSHASNYNAARLPLDLHSTPTILKFSKWSCGHQNLYEFSRLSHGLIRIVYETHVTPTGHIFYVVFDVVLRCLLVIGFTAHGLDMKNTRKSVSIS